MKLLTSKNHEMKFNWFESASPFSKFLLTLLLMLGSLFFLTTAAVFLAVPFTHMNANRIIGTMGDIQNPAYLNLIRYFQIVQSFAFFLIPAIFVTYLFGSNPGIYLSLKKRPTIVISFISIILIFSLIPFINYLQDINSKMHFPEFMKGIEQWMKKSEDTANNLSELFLNVNSIGGLILNLFMMALLPALSEEFLFRGVFQRLFSEMFKNYHWGIILSAALFSAIHFQFYGFVPRMLLGAIFGYMLVWSGTLWVPVIAHFVNNSTGILFYYLLNKGMVNSNLDKIGTGKQEMQFSIISLIISSSILVLFYYTTKLKNPKKINN
jgi:uncharacterized protein